MLHKNLLKVLSWLLVFVFSVGLQAAIPAQERAAVIALYKSTNGDNWWDNSGWKTAPLHTDGFAMPGTEHNWVGLSIYRDHVTIISLSSNHLVGTLPPELANLSQLETLDLIAVYLPAPFPPNQLSGTIPEAWGALKNLKELELTGNQLGGTIPYQLGNLTLLERLYLDDNQLTGNIPSQLGNLEKLEFLFLNGNKLAGGIPVELGNLANAEFICLENNQLTGVIPTTLGNLKKLRYLALNNNKLSGTIPTVLGNLSQLWALDLGNNVLTGTIPTILGNLIYISHFSLCSNQLTGTIPVQLANFVNAHTFRLNDNLLSGTIPASLGNLRSLDLLNLSDNQLTGIIPPELANLKELETLNLSQNQLTGSIPSGLGNLARLSLLDLSHNRLSGLIPSTLAGLNKYDFAADFWYNCLYATDPVLRAWLFKYNFSWESHQDECGGQIYMGISRTQLNFSHVVGSAFPVAQTVLISNMGTGQLNWSASSSQSWLQVSPASGTGNGALRISVEPTGLVAGDYTGSIQISANNAGNSPQTVTVHLRVHNPGETTPPFGEFATPMRYGAVANSVPVTGWVLDDVGIASVKIYNGDTYVGEAVLVEGARPDIELAYPTYPNNHKAGWGYMLLTHFLPNGGNGTYTLVAKATDTEGNEVVLGEKIIMVGNAHAITPFGAIDTPAQGATVAGKELVNFGWALTPQPNSIPTTGATMDVVVDGVVLGHPVYNQYRADIATLFPGYANSNGAIGYYYIDTTKLENGIHTISWNVTDNKGNTDGVGSRYFTVLNTPSSGDAALNSTSGSASHSSTAPFLKIPEDLNLYAETEAPIQIKELQRLEISLCNETNMKSYVSDENPANTASIPAKKFRGFQVVGDELRVLPIGSTLDQERGIFYWQPGPGFVGQYRFVFIGVDPFGQFIQRNIVVDITSR